MPKDDTRTMNCREHFEGKIVLDFGNGTGILSIFAGKLIISTGKPRLVPNMSMQLKRQESIYIVAKLFNRMDYRAK
jgi:tRNA A58 N-methylase Trm61